MTIPIQSLLLLPHIHKPCLPCQYHLLLFLLPPVLTCLPSCSCSWHHPWATLWLSGASCSLRYLFYSNSLFSTPHLLLTSLQPSQTAILTPFWTSAGHLLKTKTRISLWRPRALFKYHSGRAAHPHIHGYCYLGMVHVQSGHMRDKAISIRAQITDFSCQMQMLLLSQGKLRYFQMWMSGLNMGGFPKERAKDTFLPIPG